MKADNLKIAGTSLDNRIKVTPDQEEKIRQYKSTHPKTTFKELGEIFSVSASEAYYICNPEAKEKKKKKNREIAHRYWDKEVKRVATKKMRDRKLKHIKDNKNNKSTE